MQVLIKIRFLVNRLKDLAIRVKAKLFAPRFSPNSFIDSMCINDQLNDWLGASANDSKLPQTRHDIVYLAYPKTTRTTEK